ncbi:MAG: energy-coupling factor transporter transmembrane protein EcfT [Streptococcaceae bacterium]|jgi:energy-coupling factor transport system permease protein|nr:energy-coupling factor transporter transmembrane protein EcfT [Streptococcaceae bacterium]
MNKLILGRFIPGNSFIHRLDPRTKLVGSFYFIFILFWANNWQAYFLAAVFVFLAVLLSKIKLIFFLKGIYPMLLLIFFTVALQIFFTAQGRVLWSMGALKLTSCGLVNGAFIFIRFILIISISTLMTLTTQPLSMSDAVAFLLRPLKVVNFPVHEVSLMLSITLRFVPTLMDEAEKIMNAQRARGVDFNDVKLIQRIKAIIPLLIPLFISSFKRADELATAMEARGYQGGEGRTRYRKLTWHFQDMLVIFALILLTVGIFKVRK